MPEVDKEEYDKRYEEIKKQAARDRWKKWYKKHGAEYLKKRREQKKNSIKTYTEKDRARCKRYREANREAIATRARERYMKKELAKSQEKQNGHEPK